MNPPGNTVVGLHHVGIAVSQMETAIPFFEAMLGQPVTEQATLPDQGLVLAGIPCGPGGALVELLGATKQESTIGRFLAQRGDGLHHIALEVTDIEEVLPRYLSLGCTPLAGHPERGLGGFRTLFFHPGSTKRVLVELVDRVGREVV